MIDNNDIIARLKRLEDVVFINTHSPRPASKGRVAYSGPRGGIRLLIEEGWFKTKRELGTVREELASRGYHYSRQAVHNALAGLSRAGGPLIALRESVNRYVERK